MSIQDNKLIKLEYNIREDFAYEDLERYLMMGRKLYSYILYDKKNGVYVLSYMISENEKYNTIDPFDALVDCHNKIKNRELCESKSVLSYKQPSLDIMCKVMEPLVKNLSIKMQTNWNKIDYQDLYQMCMLTLCKLYKKGYYIHRRLLRTAFYNCVLQYNKSERYKPNTISLEELYNTEEGNSIMECVIEDEHSLDEQKAFIEGSYAEYLERKRKELINEEISPRQYDQYLREFRNKMVSNKTSVELNRLRNKLKQEGIDENFWRNYK